MDKYTKESINETIDQYLLDCLPARDELLSRMEQYGLEQGFPFVGPLAANLLAMLAASINARHIIDLGSGFGFSAMHMARVIPDSGLILCVDDNEENRKTALKYFEEAGVAHKIKYYDGDALDLFKKDESEVDIIFCDINKEQYPEAFKLGWPRIRKGGYFVADNMLWHGRVLTSEDQQPSTQGIRELTRLLYSTANARTVIIPIRDGLSVTLKTA
ncbi:O-methyltransferase [bacterium]|nr:O-methyltransferase [bacterium]MBU1638420.1 O-methyltransferase [bacterium]MBU1920960.1 O-methyltransferase [bacterium]